MAVTLKIEQCPIKVLKEARLIKWSSSQNNLSCRYVKADLAYLKDGEYDDESKWLDMQTKAIESLAQNAGMAVAIIYGKGNIDDLEKMLGYSLSKLYKRSRFFSLILQIVSLQNL